MGCGLYSWNYNFISQSVNHRLPLTKPPSRLPRPSVRLSIRSFHVSKSTVTNLQEDFSARHSLFIWSSVRLWWSQSERQQQFTHLWSLIDHMGRRGSHSCIRGQRSIDLRPAACYHSLYRRFLISLTVRPSFYSKMYRDRACTIVKMWSSGGAGVCAVSAFIFI